MNALQVHPVALLSRRPVRHLLALSRVFERKSPKELHEFLMSVSGYLWGPALGRPWLPGDLAGSSFGHPELPTEQPYRTPPAIRVRSFAQPTP